MRSMPVVIDVMDMALHWGLTFMYNHTDNIGINWHCTLIYFTADINEEICYAK